MNAIRTSRARKFEHLAETKKRRKQNADRQWKRCTPRRQERRRYIWDQIRRFRKSDIHAIVTYRKNLDITIGCWKRPIQMSDILDLQKIIEQYVDDDDKLYLEGKIEQWLWLNVEDIIEDFQESEPENYDYYEELLIDLDMYKLFEQYYY